MELTTKNGTKFNGTVTELFALEAGAPTVLNPPGELFIPCRPVEVTDGYGESFTLPSIKSAWRFYLRLAGDARFFPNWHHFHNALRGAACKKGSSATCGARFAGIIRYKNYTFRLA